MGNNTTFLDLDDLEPVESEIHLIHEGAKHFMRVLTVEGFIEQQKRFIKQQKMVEEAEKVGDDEMVSVVELIRDSIAEFFPTLPVGQLPTPKLFIIFGWLNEVSQKLNEVSAPTEGEGVETQSAEGKAE
jgi:hypothetical protein